MKAERRSRPSPGPSRPHRWSARNAGQTWGLLVFRGRDSCPSPGDRHRPHTAGRQPGVPVRSHLRQQGRHGRDVLGGARDLKHKYPQRLAIHHVLSREQQIAPAAGQAGGQRGPSRPGGAGQGLCADLPVPYHQQESHGRLRRLKSRSQCARSHRRSPMIPFHHQRRCRGWFSGI